MTDDKDIKSELEQDLEATEEEAENVKGGTLPLRSEFRTKKHRHGR